MELDKNGLSIQNEEQENKELQELVNDKQTKEKGKKDKKSRKTRNNKKTSKYVAIVFVILSVVLLILGVVLVIKTITIGATSAKKAYEDGYKISKEDAQKKQYDYAYKMSYEISEDANHVKNRATLNLGNIEQKAELEVLEVSGSEIMIEKAEDNKEKNEAWLEVVASGVYTVDLTVAEFIFDSENQHVWARVPKPVLDREHFDVQDKELLFKNDKFLNDGSIPGGENLRLELRQEGADIIFESLVSNQEYYENAEKSAEILITSLIKELNPEYKNLTVEMQFTE